MPAVQFVCPQCEKHAEVQVASVTRSRACPHCGYTVLLQVTGKEKKKARRALLVTAANDAPPPQGADLAARAKPADKAPAPAAAPPPKRSLPAPGMPAYEPQPLEGEVFERMKADPEIRAIRKRLLVGAVLVGVLIVFSIVWHFTNGSAPATGTAGRQDQPANYDASPSPASPSAAPGALANGKAPDPRSPRDAAAAGVPHGKLVFVTHDGRASDGPMTAEQRLAQVREAIETFLAADTVEALLATVANPGQVEPALRAYYRTHVLTATHATDIQHRRDPSAAVDEAPMLVTLSTGRQVPATVLVAEDGRPRVDWPSFVAFSDMDWNQFIAVKPAAPVMFRVMAEAGDWYASQFADARRFLCVKLTDPQDAAAPPRYAYAERSGPAGQKISTLLRDRSGAVPVTLRLQYPQGVHLDNQAAIESVEGDGWFVRHDGGITER